MSEKPRTVKECVDMVHTRHRDDLLKAIREAMHRNAMERRKRENLREQEIVKLHLRLMAE